MRGLFRWCLTLAIMACPAAVSAQTVTGLDVGVYIQGGGTGAVTTFSLTMASATCGQASVAPPAVVHNPRYVRVEDPANAALDCVWDTGASSGPLIALPFSSTIVYVARGQYVNVAGRGPESANSNPFDRPGTAPASAPLRLRIVG